MNANRITTITCLPGTYDPITGSRKYAIRQVCGRQTISLDIPAPNGRAAIVAFRAMYAQATGLAKVAA
jgi:hypothetical protein